MNPHFRTPPPDAPRVELEPSLTKIIGAVGFLIKEAEYRDIPVTQYDLVKSLFIADRAHLNRYGRPITFDNYVAMRHGPVPSLAYDLLKRNLVTMERHRISDLPWTATPAEQIGRGCFLFSNSRTAAEEAALSPSDLESLRSALITISGLSFGQIRELTHGDPAYKEAWGDGDSQNKLMSLGLLFDTPDFDAAEDIKFVSEHLSESESLSDDNIKSYFAQFGAG